MLGKCLPWTGISDALGGLSARDRRRAIWLLLIALLAQLRLFLTFERQMKRTGGPGIIPFELAGSTARTREILDTWGAHGRAAARRSLLLDYLFPPTYATLQALACDATTEGLDMRGRRFLAAAGPPIAGAQLAAGAFDYVENTALLLILAGRDGHEPGVARRAALVKFALISLGQAYILLGGLDFIRMRAADGLNGKRGRS